jgi:predicted transcriptional regulator with HTH domain
MITDKEFMDAIHLQLHAVRLLSNYNSSELERKISKLVIEKFSPSCKECAEIGARIKANPPQQKQGILKKIGSAINNA